MRKILFRGKRKDNGEWVYGSLMYAHGEYFIVEESATFNYGELMDYHEIFPETVGQYTGLVDKNCTAIFEGDVVKGVDCVLELREVYGYVGHGNGSFVIIGAHTNHYRWMDYDVEIVGNKHDNPELIEDLIEKASEHD